MTSVGEIFLSFEWFVIRAIRQLKSEVPIKSVEDFKGLVKGEIYRAIESGEVCPDEESESEYVRQSFEDWVRYAHLDWHHWYKYWEICNEVK